MNTLVFFMSKLSNGAKEITYTPTGFADNYSTRIKGLQTNEAAAKYIIGSLCDKGGQLDRIIAVTTREAISSNGEVASAYDVFFNGVNEFCCSISAPSPEIITVKSSLGDIVRPWEDILAEVMGYISANDEVFLDISGGRRTNADMIMLLMKLVRYKGIKLSETIYSELCSREIGTISSHKAFYRNLDILDGVNQFVTSGRSSQLIACFSSKEEDSALRRLLLSMERLTDSINLCQTSELDRLLENMRRLIDEVSSQKAEDMDTFLFMQLLPVIKEKFFGTNDKPDYCRIIDWCLDNHLVQQAVTLFVEKIPCYLFDKGIIMADETLKNDIISSYNKPEPLNIEKELFFTRLMSSNGKTEKQAREDEYIKKLKETLEKGEKSNDPVLANALKKIYSLKKFARNYDTLAAAINEINDAPDMYPYFKEITSALKGSEISMNVKTTDNHKVTNCLITNRKFLQNALNLYQQSENNQAVDTTELKFCTAIKIDSVNVPQGFSYGIDKKDLQNIMFAYLYVRSIRNMINHAGEDSNLTARQREILKSFGYSVNKRDFNSDYIINQIKTAISRISALEIKG